MFSDIFAYIDQLFHIIKPRKVFYLAVDGMRPLPSAPPPPPSSRTRTLPSARALNCVAQ